MGLEDLHRRISKLEQIIQELAKWTHFNLDTFQVASDAVPPSSAEFEEEEDKLPFEITPEVFEMDNDLPSSSESDDDSDYTPNKSSSRKRKRGRIRANSSNSFGNSKTGEYNEGFQWSLPTTSSVRAALSMKSSISENKSMMNSLHNPTQDQNTVIPIIKTELNILNDEDMETGGLSVIPSTRGRPMIQKDGYLFQLNKDATNKKIWNCNHWRNNPKCNARIHTNINLEEPQLLSFLGEHNHEPNPYLAEVRKVVAVITQEALQSTTPASEIIDNCFANLPQEIREFLPRKSNLNLKIRKLRGKSRTLSHREVSIEAPKKPRKKLVPFVQSQGDLSNSGDNDSINVEKDSTPNPLPLEQSNFQMLETKRGNPMLGCGEFLYQFSKFGINKRFWACNERRTSAKCPARIHTTNNLENLELLGTMGNHNHPGNPTAVELRHVNNAIRQDAISTTLSSSDIVAQHLSKMSPKLKELFRVEAGKRMIRKVRQSLTSDLDVGVTINQSCPQNDHVDEHQHLEHTTTNDNVLASQSQMSSTSHDVSFHQQSLLNPFTHHYNVEHS